MSRTTGCARARETLQALLDGPVPAEDRRHLDLHLAECAECRDVRDGLEAVRASLRSLAEVPFPDEALERVWDRTIRTRPAPRRRGVPWRAAAAVAASIGLTAVVVWWSGRIEPDRSALPVAHEVYAPEEIRRAEADLREVLALTAGAIDRSGKAAFERVLGQEVLPALRRVPLRWSEPAEDASRRPRT